MNIHICKHIYIHIGNNFEHAEAVNAFDAHVRITCMNLYTNIYIIHITCTFICIHICTRIHVYMHAPNIHL